MLRRNSKHRQRRPLSRSKSAYSIARDPVERLESIDPLIARRDAQIAATLSYQRAHGVTSRTHPIVKSEDNSARGLNIGRRFKANSAPIMSEAPTLDVGGNAATSDLQRQQSVRFTGPRARLSRNLAPRASRCQSSSGDLEDGSAPGGHRQTLKGIAQVHGRAFGFHSLTRNYLRSLKAAELEEIGETDGSTPPTQRKLRKSRSMFTALDSGEGGYYFSNGTPPQTGQLHRSRSRYAALNAKDEVRDHA